MRSNSGSGKSNNNLRDPTLKEHERDRNETGGRPAHGRTDGVKNAEQKGQPTQTGPAG
jgi:hypothetical protein